MTVETFIDKVNGRTHPQDRRCALLAAAQLMSNPNLLKLGARPKDHAKKVTEAADVLLDWLVER